MNTILSIHGLAKSFRMGGQKLEVLRHIDLEVVEGEILSVVGRSGSGKSTLLHHIGLLDRPDTGQVLLRGNQFQPGKPAGLVSLAAQRIGLLRLWNQILPPYFRLRLGALIQRHGLRQFCLQLAAYFIALGQYGVSTHQPRGMLGAAALAEA